MTSDPQSDLTVIWNAAAELLADERDPARRMLLFEITKKTRQVVEYLRENANG